MYGLDKKSQTKEIIEKVSEDLAIKYSVKEERIDLAALRQEKEGIEEMLIMEKPDDKELIEIGKSIYFNFDEEKLQQRLNVINKILGE